VLSPYLSVQKQIGGGQCWKLQCEVLNQGYEFAALFSEEYANFIAKYKISLVGTDLLEKDRQAKSQAK